jgi:hypothetical protein
MAGYVMNSMELVDVASPAEVSHARNRSRLMRVGRHVTRLCITVEHPGKLGWGLLMGPAFANYFLNPSTLHRSFIRLA